MNPASPVLSEIAARLLDIPTLETQGRDRHDFHEVPVWSLRSALEAAFAAGQASPVPNPFPIQVPENEPVYEDLRDAFCLPEMREVMLGVYRDGDDALGDLCFEHADGRHFRVLLHEVIR